MADGYVSQVQLPNNETYDIKDKNAVKDITSSDIPGNVSFTKGEETKDILVKDFGTAYGIDCYKGKFPLDFTSPSGVIDEWKIYGNSSGPTEVLETQSTLPVSIDTYGGNAVDWEIYGNNNPVVENKTGDLPIEVSATAGNAVDWEIEGNDAINDDSINLFNKNDTNAQLPAIPVNGRINGSSSSFPNVFMISIPVEEGLEYTFKMNQPLPLTNTPLCSVFTTETPVIGVPYWIDGVSTFQSETTGTTTFTRTAPAKAKYMCVEIAFENVLQNDIMLVKGSTAPDHYIPYQKGVGERTENLFDENANDTNNGYVNPGRLAYNNYVSTTPIANANVFVSEYIEIEESKDYTIFDCYRTSSFGGCFYNSEKTYISGFTYNKVNHGNKTVTSPANAKYIRISAATYIGDEHYKMMVTKGSTAPTTFIPYGYQIPISVNGTPQTFYIGNAPLTEGQSITKAQSGQDIALFSGDNIIDTTLINKPNTSITYNSSVLGVGEAVWIHGLSAPLRAIGDVKDTLDLSTGTLTRRVKKLVLTGEESWKTHQSTYYVTVSNYYRMYDIGSHLSVCSHYPNIQAMTLPKMHYGLGGLVDGLTHTAWNGNIVFNPSPMISSLTDWESYLAAQYATGTPVTVWYVLAEPETSTIPVPTGLTGTIEGYLIQDDTPTPENPIYPTANGEEDTGGAYKVFYSYQIPLLVTSGQQSTPHTIYIGSTPLTEGQSVTKASSGTDIALYQGNNTISTTLGNKPAMKIDYLSTVVGVGERTENLFDGSFAQGYYSTNNGTLQPSMRYSLSSKTAVAANATYTYSFSCDSQSGSDGFISFWNGETYLSWVATSSHNVATFTTPANATHCAITIGGGAGGTVLPSDISNIMLVKGSTAPSTYIPYGYQIPIDIKQGDEVVDHKDIYIGTQPLVEGDYINQTGVYRRLHQFVNYASSSSLPNYNFIPITEQLIAGNGENTITTSLANNTTIDVELHPTKQASWICDRLEDLQRRIDNVDSTLGAPERRNYLVTWCSEDRLTGSTANLDFSFNNKDSGYSTFLIDGKSTATSAFTETINLLHMINGTVQYGGSNNYTVARPGKYVIVIFGVEMEDSSSNTITLKIIRDNVVIASQQLVNEYIGCIPFEIPNDLYGNNTIIQIEVNSTTGWTDLSFGAGIAVLNATMLLQDSNLKTDTMAIGNFSMYDSYVQLLRSHRSLESKCTILENKCTVLENEYDQLANESVKDIIVYSDYTSTIPSGLSIGISQYKNKIKYVDIYFTDNNYRKGEVYPYNILAENFGYLRIPYGQIYTGASADEATRLSLSLIGDENSYYIRRELFYVSTDYEQEHLFFSQYSSIPGLILQFVGTPTNEWSDFSVKGKASEVIKIYEVHLIVSP